MMTENLNPQTNTTKYSNVYSRVPTLSLNDYSAGSPAARQHFVAELFDGLKYYGFIILKDHGIESTFLDSVYTDVEKLFALPETTKRKYISPVSGNQRGYTPFGKEHAKNNPAPDLKEFWHVGRTLTGGHKYQDVYPENIWPNEIPTFQSQLEKLYSSLDFVGDVILEALTPALKLPSNYFRDMTRDGNSILRLLHYPPLEKNMDPKSIRAAAHEDINLITILVAATTSGLELLDRDGKWLPVETDKNNLIVDAGDMLARITNDIIPSTTHRVVNPQDGKNDHRYSMPYFIHPHPEAMLECIDSCVGTGKKYPDILGQEFLMQRLREIGLM